MIMKKLTTIALLCLFCDNECLRTKRAVKNTFWFQGILRERFLVSFLEYLSGNVWLLPAMNFGVPETRVLSIR